MNFVLVNNVFKEYNDMKEVIKNLDNRWICLMQQTNVNLRKKFTNSNKKSIYIVLNAQNLHTIIILK